jgi:hypothetical protein
MTVFGTLFGAWLGVFGLPLDWQEDYLVLHKFNLEISCSIDLWCFSRQYGVATSIYTC